ncbi:unnamed protein product [Merluccius merluccius]
MSRLRSVPPPRLACCRRLLLSPLGGDVDHRLASTTTTSTSTTTSTRGALVVRVSFSLLSGFRVQVDLRGKSPPRRPPVACTACSRESAGRRPYAEVNLDDVRKQS